MKFLICGLGSIGKRHIENLERLGFPCEDILIFRTNKGAKGFGDEFLKTHDNRHPIFNNLGNALNKKPDVAFITNPTSLHIPVALEAAKAGCHLFIEKPLSHSLAGVETLIKIVTKKNLVAFVAYYLRFHPLLRQINHRVLESDEIGKVVSIHAEMAERVTDWHPWENYKISYASRKDLGGGVILTQSHELDYLYWLFGMPKWIFSAGGELGNLEIGVEDTVKSIMEFRNGAICSLHVDYLKRPAQRFLEITGTKGRIYWDYYGKKVEFIPLRGKPKASYEPANFERNTMYMDELKYFLACVKNGIQPLVDLRQGKDVLKMALATKKSMQNKKIVYLK